MSWWCGSLECAELAGRGRADFNLGMKMLLASNFIWNKLNTIISRATSHSSSFVHITQLNRFLDLKSVALDIFYHLYNPQYFVFSFCPHITKINQKTLSDMTYFRNFFWFEYWLIYCWRNFIYFQMGSNIPWNVFCICKYFISSPQDCQIFSLQSLFSVAKRTNKKYQLFKK